MIVQLMTLILQYGENHSKNKISYMDTH